VGATVDDILANAVRSFRVFESLFGNEIGAGYPAIECSERAAFRTRQLR
jgi:hypothetical protein